MPLIVNLSHDVVVSRPINSGVRSSLNVAENMSFNYTEAISNLNPEQRLHFYELFAHNLTIAIRSIWSDGEISDADKVERIRLVNEILHRVTSKIYVLRLNLHEWTEEDTWKMIEEYVSENKDIESEVNVAIKFSYGVVGNA